MSLRFSSPFPNLGNLDFQNVGISSSVTFYVETTGDDVTGDGYSPSTAFATPQRAVDEIPNNAVGNYTIQCGAGTFEAPKLSRIPGPAGQLSVVIVGDRSSPDIVLSSPSFSLISGKAAQYTDSVGAYGATVTDLSHWIEDDFGLSYSFPFSSATVLASTSPDLNLVGDPFAPALVHPFLTIFTIGVSTGVVYESDAAFLYFVGIKFEPTSFVRIENSNLAGCCLSGSGSGFRLQNCSGYITSDKALQIYSTKDSPSNAVGGLFDNTSTLISLGTQVMFNSIVCRSSFLSFGTNGAVFVDQFGGFGIDLEGSAFSISKGSSIIQQGDITSTGQATFLTLTENSQYVRTAGAITGSTTGVCVTLDKGSQVIGLAAVDGTLTNSTTPGDEIRVGEGAAPDSFSDLPTTDLSTLCRGT